MNVGELLNLALLKTTADKWTTLAKGTGWLIATQLMQGSLDFNFNKEEDQTHKPIKWLLSSLTHDIGQLENHTCYAVYSEKQKRTPTKQQCSNAESACVQIHVSIFFL